MKFDNTEAPKVVEKFYAIFTYSPSQNLPFT